MTISAEARFLTLCVREPRAGRRRMLEASAARVREWGNLCRLAEAHRVAAYVRSTCREENICIPADVEEALRRESLATTARVMQLESALTEIIGGFEAASLPVTVLKGPALARTIYPRPELRPYGDLDLTVRSTHEPEAVSILNHLGFREVPYAAERARATRAAHVSEGSPFHRTFTDEAAQVLVELHLDSLQLGLRPACEAGRWQRAQPLPSRPGALMLCPEDQLVQLSVHAHKHGFERLIWLKDIDLLLRTSGERLRWKMVRQVADREGVASSVWYTMLLTHRLLGTPLPRSVVATLAPTSPIRALYSLIWPATRIAGLEGFLRRRAVQFHAAEAWRGMLPSLVVMGRRGLRLRAMARQLVHR
jgi:hypothetical protein